MQKKYITLLLSLAISSQIVACSSALPIVANNRAYFNSSINDYAYCNDESCPQATKFTLDDEEEKPIYIAPTIADKQKVEEKINVHYDFSKSYLRTADVKKLETTFNRLKGKSIEVVIIGYTDNIEANNHKQFNTKLAQKRAAVVKDFLIKHFGVKGADIKVEGKPLCCYVANNKTKLGRAENRRAEVTIYIQSN